MYGFESRMPLQPFYSSIVNGRGCFAARVRGLMRRRVQQLLHSNSQKVKTFSSQEKIVGSIPTSINTRLVHMVDSSKWSGGLPLTRKIVGSSPLSTTTLRDVGYRSPTCFGNKVKQVQLLSSRAY